MTTPDTTSAQRDDGICFYCGEMTNSLSGMPSRWPLLFPELDGTGVVKHHHVGCVLSRLSEIERLRAQLDAIKDKLGCIVAENNCTGITGIDVDYTCLYMAKQRPTYPLCAKCAVERLLVEMEKYEAKKGTP